MRLLAIDPASYSTGLAIFDNGVLQFAFTTQVSVKEPQARRLAMAQQIYAVVVDQRPSVVACEEPSIQGRNGNAMHRLLGMIEFLSETPVNYVHPMTLKAFFGSGKLDKFEMALAAGEMLKTDAEKEMIAQFIEREEWDATDAICVGLAYLSKKAAN